MKRLSLFILVLLLSLSPVIPAFTSGSPRRLLAQDNLPQYGTLYAAQWSPDGTRVLAGAADGLIIVWDAATGAELQRLGGNSDALFNGGRGRWSPDGTRIVTWSDAHTARIWDAENGELVQTLTGHTDAIQSVLWSPDGNRLVSISQDTTARVWDAATGETLVVFSQHSAPLEDVEWSADGTRIATAADDSTARIWDAATGKELFVLGDREPTSMMVMANTEVSVLGVAWSPDNTRIVTTGDDGVAILWDTTSGKKIGVMRLVEPNAVMGYFLLDAYWSPDGKRILIHAPFEIPPSVWDASTGNFLYELKGHTDAVTRTRWKLDGTQIMTAGVDGTIRFWDAESGAPLRMIDARTSLWSAEFSPDELLIISTADNGTIRLWDANSGEEYQFIFPPADGSEPQINLIYTKSMAELQTQIAPTLALIAGMQKDQGTAAIGVNMGIIAVDAPEIWDYSGIGGEIISVTLTSDDPLRMRILIADNSVLAEMENGSLTTTLPTDGQYRFEVSTGVPLTQFTIINYTLTLASTRSTPTPAA